MQICADDPLTVAHAQRMLVKDARRSPGRAGCSGLPASGRQADDGLTQRNVMGQLDGTANPTPAAPTSTGPCGSTADPAWLHGGTTLVVRRIRAEMETWDAADTRRQGVTPSAGAWTPARR